MYKNNWLPKVHIMSLLCVPKLNGFDPLSGVEKNNDDCRWNYFSSNGWDAPGDILQKEARLELLKSRG